MMGTEEQRAGFAQCLAFDVEEARRDIVEFVRAEVKNFGADGALVGLSGGLDSSTVACLCVEALGRDRVMGLVLPERDTSPVNTGDAIDLAKRLGIQYQKIDISPILRDIGAYGLISHEEASDRTAMERAVERIKRMTGKESPFAERSGNYKAVLPADLSRGSANLLAAFSIAKVRTRMTMLYFHAILKNYIVVGTTDLSEYSIGFYDTHGDGASDISILKHLYKTQIQQLAKHIGVPEQIVTKPSSGDLFGMGIPNETFIGLSYLKLDSILCGIKAGASDAEIASGAGVKPDTVESIRKAMRAARFRESLPLSPPEPPGSR